MPFTLDDTVVIDGSINDTLWSKPSVYIIDRSSLPKKEESGDFLVRPQMTNTASAAKIKLNGSTANSPRTMWNKIAST